MSATARIVQMIFPLTFHYYLKKQINGFSVIAIYKKGLLFRQYNNINYTNEKVILLIAFQPSRKISNLPNPPKLAFRNFRRDYLMMNCIEVLLQNILR